MNFIAQNFKEYQQLYKDSTENPEQFWNDFAQAEFTWKKPWDKVLGWDFKEAEVKWFEGAELNITENCLDRHLDTIGDKTAIIWENNDPNEASINFTYKELHEQVCRFANTLLRLGITKGDRVCIYLPMVPELAIATLACARIGAIHSIVFAGFSAQSLKDRINDSDCKIVLTADGGYRGDKITPLKQIVDEALKDCPSIEHCLVLKRTNTPIVMGPKDKWWTIENEKSDINCPAVAMQAEDPLFILYTSGSTGKPKGMVHTTAGYMVYTNFSFRNVFQIKDDDIYWCTADIGWITGHSYILYGPLSAGATTVMFEGVPSYPDMGRFWEIIDKYQVTIFYTAPTAIRALEQCDISFVKKHSLKSLRTLGTVGEPINEEAWHWYNKNIGNNNCPIVDTWWQTETGGIMISPLAGITTTKPTFATLPLPGVQPFLFDEKNNVIHENNVEGRLGIQFPWPSMARTIWGDHQRFKDTYFSTFANAYFTGDGCKRDEDGYYRITGRVDDIVIVSGHNLGTAEIENAIDDHPNVAESAVVGYPHNIKGNAIYAFVTCYTTPQDEDQLRIEILKLVADTIGPIAKPDKIQFTTGLPKTRSGKIMRRILRKIAANEADSLGDISTLLNPEVVEDIINGALLIN
jgi:acetyl-CoA synthetase